MPSPQRARSGVPLDQRSVVPSVPGIPAWGAVAVAVGASLLGIVVDSFGGNELTSTFAALYLVGCVAAVLLVRHRGLFTAMAQPPLIIFFGVPLAYQFLTTDAGTSIKDIVLNVAIPLVNRFPLMMAATVLVLLIGAGRLLLDRKPHKPAKTARRRAGAKPATTTSSRTRVSDDASTGRSADSSPWRRPRSDDDNPRGERSGDRDRRSRTETPPRRSRAQEPSRRADRPTKRGEEPLDGALGQHSRQSQAGRGPREQPRDPSRRGSYAPTEHSREPSHLREPLTSYSSERDRAPRDYAPRDYERRSYDPGPSTRRSGADNPALTPHPAPRVRYRDRD